MSLQSYDQYTGGGAGAMTGVPAAPPQTPVPAGWSAATAQPPQHQQSFSPWTAQQQPGSQQAMPFFDDPLSQPLMESWGRRMTQLRSPGPNYGDVERTMWGSMKEDPRLTGLLKNLQGLTTRAGPANAYLGQYAGATQGRMKELNAEPFDASAEAALKARFFDDLARSRDDRTQQLQQRLASMGMAPTSGTAQEAGALLEGEYEGARAGQQRDLLKYVTDERNRRRDLAVEMSGGLSQHGQADANNRAQYMSQQANLGQGLAGILANLQTNRANVAQGIAGLRRQSYLDTMERGGQELDTSALPSALGQQRMTQLQQLLSGNTPTQQQLFEQQMAQQNAANEQQRYADQNRTNMWGAIGQFAAPALGAVAGHYFPSGNK
jgi:hypothetical protein